MPGLILPVQQQSLSPRKPSAPLAQPKGSMPTSQRSDIQELQTLADQYGTVEQQEALKNSNSIDAASLDAALKLADDAALQEGIQRSLKDYAFYHFSPSDSGSSIIPSSNCTTDAQPSSSNVKGKQETIDNSQASHLEQAERVIEQEYTKAQEKHNKLLETYLQENNFDVLKSSGEGYNCLIYSLVQAVIPGNQLQCLNAKVKSIRGEYDKAFPEEEGKMLRFDRTTASMLISLINEEFKVNMQAMAITACPPEFNEGKVFQPDSIYTGKPPTSSFIVGFTHSVVIWDQNGHFDLIIARPFPSNETRHLA